MTKNKKLIADEIEVSRNKKNDEVRMNIWTYDELGDDEKNVTFKITPSQAMAAGMQLIESAALTENWAERRGL